MFYNLSESTSEGVERCLELIARCAPRMMRVGGGALTREKPSAANRLTWGRRQRILRLAQRADLTQAEVARRVGCSQPTVYKVLKKFGLR